MEPFRVTCETCRARLKVRDASAIGEIHACPKCGSMVHILPPADWMGNAAAAAEITAVSLVKPAVTPPTEPDFAHVPPPSDELADMFEAAASSIHKVEVSAGSPAGSPSIGEAALAESLTARAPRAPFVPSSAVLWTAAASAAMLVSGLAIAFWPGGSGEAPEPPEQPAAAAATEPPPQQMANVIETPPVDTALQSPAETHVAAKPVPDEPVDAATEVAPALTETPSESTSEPVATTIDESQDVPAPDSSVDLAAAPPETSDTDTEAAPVLKFDPLDFDPANLSLAGSTLHRHGLDRESIAGESATGSVNDEEPADVDGADVDVASNGPNDDFELAMPQEHSASVRLGPMPGDAQPQDAMKLLAFKVGAMQIADAPLHRFIETVCDFAGGPITLDPVALQLAGVSPRAGVSVDQSSVSLDKLLESALSKHRLELVARDGNATIALADADRRSSRQFEFKDLIEAGQSDASALAELIQTFAAPQSWKGAGGAGTIAVDGTKLRIEQTKAVHHELLVFCERLRLARGLALKSRYPKDMLALDSPYTLLELKLSEPTTFTFLPWSRLTDVVRHWQDTSGITILVDWQHLADAELGPATPVACSAVDRNWDEAFDEILETLGLAWWAVDAQTIQITTADALNAIHRVEFYALNDSFRDQFANADALIEALGQEIDKQVGGSGQFVMRVDSPSGRLIVRGTPPVHRYLTGRLAERVIP